MEDEDFYIWENRRLFTVCRGTPTKSTVTRCCEEKSDDRSIDGW